ncbi:MAG: hypothetical protein K6D96_05900 [Acetatifactor sp.]|nr:hypothetical protein [Acetatifactor sp.]
MKKDSLCLKTDKGSVVLSVGLFLMLFFMVTVLFCLDMAKCMTAASYVEDGLSAALLSAEEVEFGMSGEGLIVVLDPDISENIYNRELRANLNLDEEFMPGEPSVFAGKVRPERFLVYNVSETQTSVFEKIGNRCVYIGTFDNRSVYAPSGKKVEKTGIFASVDYSVKGFFGNIYEGNKSKLVDVVIREESDEG